MSLKEYVLVEFEKENGAVDLVHRAWMGTDEDGRAICSWPTKIAKDYSSYRRHLILGTEPGSDWAHGLNVKIKYQTDDLKKADEKVNLLETTSDIETDTGAGDHSRARPMRSNAGVNRRLESSGDEDNSPLKKRKKTTPTKKHGRAKKITPQTSQTETEPQRVVGVAGSSRSSSDSVVTELFASPNPPSRPVNTGLPDLGLSPVGPTSAFSQGGDRHFQKTVLDLLVGIKQTVKANSRAIAKLEAAVAVGANGNGGAAVVAEFPEVAEETLDLLPLKSVEDLNRLEALLGKNAIQAHIARLVRICAGGNLSQVVKKLMPIVFTNDLAKLYNRTGSKGKKSLQSAKGLWEVLSTTVQKACPHDTAKAIDDRISVWLTGARDREGGRKSRGEGPQVAPENAEDEDGEPRDEGASDHGDDES